MNIRSNLTAKRSECFGVKLGVIVNSDGPWNSEEPYNVWLENFKIVAEVIVAKEFALIHLKKYSTATTAYFKFP
jgi:hypothetical protein